MKINFDQVCKALGKMRNMIRTMKMVMMMMDGDENDNEDGSIETVIIMRIMAVMMTAATINA